MTQTDTGSAQTSGPEASGGGDSLDSLRADLARLILNEAGQALGRNPDLPLSAALVQAVERQSAQTAQAAQNQIPSAQALADAVVDAVSPELVRIAQAAGAGDTARLTRRPAKAASNLPLALVAAVAGALLFVGGFLTARFLPDRAPEPAPAVVAPAEPSLTIVDPNAPAATGETATAAPAAPPAQTKAGRPAQ